jgi:hypothetical protein
MSMRSRQYGLTALLLLSISCDDCDPPEPEPTLDGGPDPSVKGCAAAASAVLDAMVFYPQEAKNWCWAAGAQMLMEYEQVAGLDVSQCRQAELEFGALAGCECHACEDGGAPTLGACDSPAEPDFGSFDFDAGVTASGHALSENELRKQLSPDPCPHRPVAFSYTFDLDTRPRTHMRVVFGFFEIGSELWLDVVDPLGYFGPCSDPEFDQISYEDFREIPSVSVHGRDYYNVRYAP